MSSVLDSGASCRDGNEYRRRVVLEMMVYRRIGVSLGGENYLN